EIICLGTRHDVTGEISHCIRACVVGTDFERILSLEFKQQRDVAQHTGHVVRSHEIQLKTIGNWATTNGHECSRILMTSSSQNIHVNSCPLVVSSHLFSSADMAA